ncbi:transglutaminase TgpA family protein [Solwaraspora sp. WMMB335]|uniref:transglutaminase TgpA family protein n=1 Tax=Solwaraspora sp. WMMB335 TaxID=3404118 RepID=UPI003B935826
MSARRHLGFVAAAATLMAAAPMATIFDSWTWLVQCAITVVLIGGVGTLVRTLRAPGWLHPVAMTAALVLALTWLFPSGNELFAVLPSPATISHFGGLLAQSARDVHAYGVPVPDGDPLLFITVLGIGAVAIVVDVLTVTLRRPALAGLPMLAIYSIPVAIYIDSVPAVPFVVGAAGYLWLLMADNVDRVRRFGRRFTGDGRDVDVWEPSPLAAAGRRLAVAGVVVAVLVPVAIPGMTSGLLTNLSGSGVGGNGLGTGPGQVNLFAALSGQLTQSEVTEMVRVATDDPTPAYLRIGTADEVSESGFDSRPPRGRPASARSLPDPREDPDIRRTGVTHQAFQATVEISDDFNMALLPTYAVPVQMRDIDGSWAYDATAQIVFSGRSRAGGLAYGFEYVRSSYTVGALRRAQPLAPDDEIRQRFTPVPQVAQVDALVAELIAGARTDYDRVRAVYDYFSRDNGFTYSLSTEGGTAGQDIVNFLENKVGFCQQYAAAMAWLVRAADVPARVAFGFTNGSRRAEGRYVLTNLNLHAWTEVYFDGLGWVPFDATPAASVPGSVRSEWAPDVDAPQQTAPTAGPSAAPGAAPSAGPLPESLPGNLDEGDLGLDGTAGAPSGPRWPLWVLVAAAVLAVLLALPAARRATVRRRRLARTLATTATATDRTGDGDAEEPAAGASPVVVVTGADADAARAHAHAAWSELIDTMVDLRVPVDRSETPRATAQRLAAVDSVRDTAADAVRLLGQAEERARYARQPVEGGPLVEALRRTRNALAAGATRRTRLMARLLPPSVLLRWRGQVVEAYGQVFAVVGRWRDGVVRFSPRRLLASRLGR